MREPAPSRSGLVRRALFVAFAACTLWLVVENSILLAVLPRLIAHAHGVATP
jgi:hypothetical protein